MRLAEHGVARPFWGSTHICTLCKHLHKVQMLAGPLYNKRSSERLYYSSLPPTNAGRKAGASRGTESIRNALCAAKIFPSAYL